jgi:hypothetical protein
MNNDKSAIQKFIPICGFAIGLLLSDVNELVLLFKKSDKKYYQASLALSISTLIFTVLLVLIEIFTATCKCEFKEKSRKCYDTLKTVVALCILIFNSANIAVDAAS